MKTTPSIPTDAHGSHSRTVSGSVVDGHRTHKADVGGRRTGTQARSCSAGTCHPVVSARDSRSRSNATKCAGHSTASRPALAPRR
ncbi:hypothetical protein [Streptomyces puniciscabiei]|uniref:hypothetical protein n=1 Tax=Streptomyces puniciscabiei TaxID=164348 RepID=UPI0033309F63